MSDFFVIILFTLKIEIPFGEKNKIYQAVSCYGLGNKYFFTFSIKHEVISNG